MKEQKKKKGESVKMGMYRLVALILAALMVLGGVAAMLYYIIAA